MLEQKYSMHIFLRNLSVHQRFAGWSSSRQTTEKCPMCSEIFPLSMTMTDRTVHINDHLPV